MGAPAVGKPKNEIEKLDEAVAGNGLLHRRVFLQGGLIAGGGALMAGGAQAAAAGRYRRSGRHRGTALDESAGP